jgi:hypothetical protein
MLVPLFHLGPLDKSIKNVRGVYCIHLLILPLNCRFTAETVHLVHVFVSCNNTTNLLPLSGLFTWGISDSSIIPGLPTPNTSIASWVIRFMLFHNRHFVIFITMAAAVNI